MMVGAPGTGKSIVLEILMRQALAPMAAGTRDDRALIYDPKREFVSKLQSLGLYDAESARELGVAFDEQKCRRCVVITNPIDERASYWSIAHDFDELLDGEVLAAMFTAGARAEVKEANARFFEATTNQLFAAVFTALHSLKRGRWTLRDFILAFADEQRLERLLTQPKELAKDDLEDIKNTKRWYKETGNTWRAYLGKKISEGDVAPSIFASIKTYLTKMSRMAAAWHAIQEKHPLRTFAFRKWVDERGVVLLGSSEKHENHLELVNRLMFHKASVELAEHQSQNVATRNTWVFLDEVHELGYLPKLQSLLAKGRSRGIRVAIAFQDYGQMVLTFGAENAQTITAIVNTVGATQCRGKTAKWLSEMFGSYQDQQGRDTPNVRESEFSTLSKEVKTDGVSGWYYSGSLTEGQVQKHVIPWKEVEPVLLTYQGSTDVGHGRAEEDYLLEEWRDSELEELGLIDTPPEARAEPQPTPDRPGGPGHLPEAHDWPDDSGLKKVEHAGQKAQNTDMTNDGRPRNAKKSSPMKLILSRSDEEMAAIKARKNEGRKVRYVEYEGETIDVFVTDIEFEKLCKDQNALRTAWHLYKAFSPYEKPRDVEK